MAQTYIILRNGDVKGVVGNELSCGKVKGFFGNELLACGKVKGVFGNELSCGEVKRVVGRRKTGSAGEANFGK